MQPSRASICSSLCHVNLPPSPPSSPSRTSRIIKNAHTHSVQLHSMQLSSSKLLYNQLHFVLLTQHTSHNECERMTVDNCVFHSDAAIHTLSALAVLYECYLSATQPCSCYSRLSIRRFPTAILALSPRRWHSDILSGNLARPVLGHRWSRRLEDLPRL